MARPNIIVICLDSFRSDILGPYNGSGLSPRGFTPSPSSLNLASPGSAAWIDTPNLDLFAEKSYRYTNAYGEALPTIPARRSFFTGERAFPWRFNPDHAGLSPPQLGWHRIPEHQQTLAETLLFNGYFTALVSDNYHMFKPGMNFQRGFIFWDWIRGHQADPHALHVPDSVMDRLRDHVPDGEEDNMAFNRHVITYLSMNQNSRPVDRLFDRAFEVVDGCKDRPFFLWLDCFTPHEPWDVSSKYSDQYFPGSPDVKDYIDPGWINRLQNKGRPVSQDEVDRTKALYAGLCTYLDVRLGVFFDFLHRSNLFEDTAIIVVSDHGLELMDDGRFTKYYAGTEGRLHKYNTGMELLVRPPGGVEFSEIPEVVQAHDLFWIILSLARVDIESHHMEEMKGRELAVIGWGKYGAVVWPDKKLTMVVDTEAEGARPFYYHSDNRGYAIEVSLSDKDKLMRALVARLGSPLPVHHRHCPTWGLYGTMSYYLNGGKAVEYS